MVLLNFTQLPEPRLHWLQDQHTVLRTTHLLELPACTLRLTAAAPLIPAVPDVRPSHRQSALIAMRTGAHLRRPQLLLCFIGSHLACPNKLSASFVEKHNRYFCRAARLQVPCATAAKYRR